MFNAREMLTPACYDRMIRLNDQVKNQTLKDWTPKIMLLAQCTEPNLINPFNGRTEITRGYLLGLFQIIDFIIVLGFTVMLLFIHRISKRALSEFKDLDKRLEVRDFAIQVTGLPSISDYKCNTLLKVMLWQHFEKVAKEQPQQIEHLS